MYNREFCQQTTASAVREWSALDNTLWNLARQTASHPPKTQSARPPSKPYHVEQTFRLQPYSALPQSRKAPICLEWNDSPAAGCPHSNCHYKHSCYRCIHMPTISDKHHKAIHCPNKDRKSSAFIH